MAGVVSSSSVESRPAPHSVAHPRHVPALERPIGALHHRRPRLPSRGGTAPTRWRPPCRRCPSPSRTATPAPGPARRSGSATRVPRQAPTLVPGRASYPALHSAPRHLSANARQCPPVVAVAVLPSASAGQGLPSSVAEYQTSDAGIEMGVVDPSLPPRLLQPGMGPLSHLLRWRRWGRGGQGGGRIIR
jgi:hypothetical protein